MSDDKKGGLKRRDFIKLLGVAGTTAAVTGGCSSDPVEQIIPYVVPPEKFIPGIPSYFASTCRECPAGCGIVVKNREGRAIKIEGNPDSPINMGATCARGQAGLQGLYNPDRIRSPLRYKEESGRLAPVGWQQAEKTFAEKVSSLIEQGKGDRIVYLSNNISGTFKDLVTKWLESTGGGKHYSYETFAHEPIRKANELVYGKSVIPNYRLGDADYVLSFGADFLETWLSPVNYSKGFSKLHTVKDGQMGKVVQIEPRMSMTGASADKWVSIRPGAEMFLALGIANVIVNKGWAKSNASSLSGIVSGYTPEKVSGMTDVSTEMIEELARNFSSNNSLAIGGGSAYTSTNATETQVAINILNHIAGNVGKTVDFTDKLMISDLNSYDEIAGLVEKMKNGEVEMLIVHNANPVFTLPKSLNVKEAISKVPHVVSFSSFMDETTELASLVMPDNSYLESWGDYQPTQGYVGIMQPVMNPVFNTKQTGDVLISVSKQIESAKENIKEETYLEYLTKSWRRVAEYVSPGVSFDKFWKETIEKGGVSFELPSQQVELSTSVLNISFDEPEIAGEGDVYFITYPSYRFYDGTGANKPWLQELPDALTTSVWDSFVEIHPDTASKLGIETGTYVDIETSEGSIRTQAFVYEGIRPDTVAVPFGLGHKSYGRYAEGRGVNPLDILPASSDRLSGGFAWLSSMATIRNSGHHELLVRTQYTTHQHDRIVAKTVDINELGKHDEHKEHEEPDFYPEREYSTYRWGMAIDLSKCTGCGACVTACYAENNIPFVGKDQVAKRRDMSWLRIERYFEKDKDGNLDTRFLPMLCQQCGNAPCEPVCPVYATYHNHEGLNGMIYNRCVGTRYCANNCTYKVRRFNWYTYSFPEPLNWQLNPDVTVRTKGVMEKCTFCVQRIKSAQDIAKDESRTVEEGDFMTACQQACASEAITFGNLLEEESKVAQLSNDERGYRVLEVVNTKPGITYLKKVKWDKV